MEKTNWKDWLNDTKEGYEQLRKRCSKVYVMGLSMGGILTLLLAEQYPVDKIVSIAAPIRIYDRLAPYACIFKYFKRFNRWENSEPSTGENTQYNIGYSGVPVKCVPSLLNLMKKAEKSLSQVICPTLIVQSYTDETVKPISAQIIYDGIAAPQKEIFWLEQSKHICTLGLEREIMHEKIISFLKV